MVCWLAAEDVGRASWDSPENGFAGFSLAVRGGECVALAGRAGAVSAALRILAGDERPSGGRVRVLHAGAEVDLTGDVPGRLLEIRRVTIGVVESALRFLPHLTGVEVVAVPALRAGRAGDVAADTARRLLAALGVPVPLWHRTAAHWPAAERRKLAVARAFAVDYPVVLADDPFSGLDAAAAAAAGRLLRQAVERGSAVVLTGEGAAGLAGRTVPVDGAAAVAALPSSPTKRPGETQGRDFRARSTPQNLVRKSVTVQSVQEG